MLMKVARGIPDLGCWRVGGLAQPVNLMLSYAKQDFNDVQYEQGDGPDLSGDAWLKVKPTLGLDFPNLPFYIEATL